MYDLALSHPDLMKMILVELGFSVSLQHQSEKIDIMGENRTMNVKFTSALTEIYFRYLSDSKRDGLDVGDFQDFLLDCNSFMSKEDIELLFERVSSNRE